MERALDVLISIAPDGMGRLELAKTGPGWTEIGPEWSGNFQLDERSHDALYEVLRENLFGVRYPDDATEHLVGSGSFTLTATAAGATAHVPAFATDSRRRKPKRLEETVRNAVPDALWSELETARRRALSE